MDMGHPVVWRGTPAAQEIFGGLDLLFNAAGGAQRSFQSLAGGTKDRGEGDRPVLQAGDRRSEERTEGAWPEFDPESPASALHQSRKPAAGRAENPRNLVLNDQMDGRVGQVVGVKRRLGVKFSTPRYGFCLYMYHTGALI